MSTLITLFRFIAMKGKTQNQTEKKEITSITIRNKNYDNFIYRKTNSPLAFAARSASCRTGACRLAVDSHASPRNAPGGRDDGVHRW
jgi:hypothetical protein